jgi:hypothetical protein
VILPDSQDRNSPLPPVVNPTNGDSISSEHWQHFALSHAINTPKHNQQKQKQPLYTCLVTLKVRILKTKSGKNILHIKTVWL